MTCNILLVYTHPTRNLQKLAFHHQNAKLVHHQRQFNPHETNINNILCHQIDADFENQVMDTTVLIMRTSTTLTSNPHVGLE
jgi:hypothetical protein